MNISKANVLNSALVSAVLFFGIPAIAADQGSQLLFFQAGPGQLAISAGMTKISSSVDLKISGASAGDAQFESSLTHVALEYGLSNALSLEFDTSQGTEETVINLISPPSQSIEKYAGMGDLGALAKFNLDSGSMLLRFQAGLNVNNGNKVAPAGSKDGNRSSGGLSVPLILGVGYKMGSTVVGVRASYDNLLERKTDSSGSISTTTGGNITTAKAFLEYNSSFLAAAISAGTFTEAESTDKAANGSETVNKAVTGTVAGIDLGFSLSKNLTLLANYELSARKYQDGTLDDYTINLATFGGGIRLMF